MHRDLRSSIRGIFLSADLARARRAELFLRRLNGELRPPWEWGDATSRESEDGLQIFQIAHTPAFHRDSL